MINPARSTDNLLHVVYVTSNPDKAQRFARLLAHTRWEGKIASTVTDAQRLAASDDNSLDCHPVFICDEALSDGVWTDVIETLRRPLIVATDRLNLSVWKEAMARGAADVIDTTFDLRDVVQAVSVAWLYQRYRQHQLVPA